MREDRFWFLPRTHQADTMLWFFEREGLQTRVEVLHLPDGTYELRVLDADEAEHIERFTNAAELAKSQQAIQDALVANGWQRSGEWLV